MYMRQGPQKPCPQNPMIAPGLPLPFAEPFKLACHCSIETPEIRIYMDQ